LLAPLVERCRAAGVRFLERALVFGLRVDEGGGVAGALVVKRDGSGEPYILASDAVVLACGGVGGAYPMSTAPRWCRGSGLALAHAGSALLHHPHLLQALPLARRPRGYFPTSRALLEGTVWLRNVGVAGMGSVTDLTRKIAESLEISMFVTPYDVTLEPRDMDSLPEPLKRDPEVLRTGRIPISVGVHHSVGGVAIDEWGRTSVPGLYACGEAAGGVQGRRRTMGTGLIEARIFGVRAGRAVARDAARLRGRRGVKTVSPTIPSQPAVFERFLDVHLASMACMVNRAEVLAVWRDVSNWPSRRPAFFTAEDAAAGLRRWAIMKVLESARDADLLDSGGGEGT